MKKYVLSLYTFVEELQSLNIHDQFDIYENYGIFGIIEICKKNTYTQEHFQIYFKKRYKGSMDDKCNTCVGMKNDSYQKSDRM